MTPSGGGKIGGNMCGGISGGGKTPGGKGIMCGGRDGILSLSMVPQMASAISDGGNGCLNWLRGKSGILRASVIWISVVEGVSAVMWLTNGFSSLMSSADSGSSFVVVEFERLPAAVLILELLLTPAAQT